LLHPHIAESFKCIGLLEQIGTVAIHESSFVKKSDIARQHFCIESGSLAPQIGLFEFDNAGVGLRSREPRGRLLYSGCSQKEEKDYFCHPLYFSSQPCQAGSIRTYVLLIFAWSHSSTNFCCLAFSAICLII